MKKLLLALTFTAIAPFSALAESPTPDQMGEFLAREMCADYETTGVLFDDSGYERIAGKLLAEYGGESALLLLEMASKFSQPGPEIANDPYLFPMFQSLFTNMANNDECFRKFLAEEVFDEEESDTEAAVPDPSNLPADS